MGTMLAARYLGPDRIEARQVLLPEIAPGEALVRVEACGFCGSDINIVAGTHPRAQAPLTIGHELSGSIVEIAEPTAGLAVGDRVTTYPLISCGVCYACTHGNPHVCRQLRLFGFDIDGGMAEFVKLPVDSLMKLPDDMPASIGALIEPLAVAVHGVHRVQLDGVNVVAVLGAGPIGILTALVAKQTGIPHVRISDVLPARLELATSLGLTAVPAGALLRAEIMNVSDQNGADVVYECAGHPSSAKEMTALVRSRGTIVNLGVFKRPVEVDLQAINFKEVEIVGSRVYERKDFQAAIEMAMSLPLASIISREFSLDDVSDAFRLFRAGEVCKVLILPVAGSQ
jgi:(R,R)-butanediol dehydrogenase/meso-butanediol dehydrogenase/diacetyl reductase